MRTAKGFTLVEIMITLLILAVLLTIAVPNIMNARQNSEAQSCIANLHQIDTAKQQIKTDLKMQDTDTPSQVQLLTYMIAGWPICPDNGTYTINDIATNPTCSYNNPNYPHVMQ